MIRSVNEGGFRITYSTRSSGFVFFSARFLKKGEEGTIPYMNVFVSILEQKENSLFDIDFFAVPFYFGWGICEKQDIDLDEFFMGNSFISYCLYINFYS